MLNIDAMKMKTGIDSVARLGASFCLAMSIAPPNAHAGEAAGAAPQDHDIASASTGDMKVSCAPGLLPFAATGTLTGSLNVPLGTVSFSGENGWLGYCGLPAPDGAISLAAVKERRAASNGVSSIRTPNGVQLVCAHGDLPLVLKGSAEGQLRTRKGIVVLHGKDNELAVCLIAAMSK